MTTPTEPTGTLYITVRAGQTVRVSGPTTVTVIEKSGKMVKLKITAPLSTVIEIDGKRLNSTAT